MTNHLGSLEHLYKDLERNINALRVTSVEEIFVCHQEATADILVQRATFRQKTKHCGKIS